MARASTRLIAWPDGRKIAVTSSMVQELLPVPEESAIRLRRLAWADLLRRVFAVDVLECPRPAADAWGLLVPIQPSDVTQAILDRLELPSRAPPTAAAVPDPDHSEEWPGDFEATL